MSTVYQIVTDRILACIDRGTAPWRLPFSTVNQMPRNLSSGKEYRGCNVWMLAATAWMQGYQSAYWVTYKQAQDRGGQVRKGEKSTPVVFWKFLDVVGKSTGKPERIPMLRYYSVFNVSQCDGLEYPKPAQYQHDPIAAAQALADGYLAAPRLTTPDNPPVIPPVIRPGQKAAYSPAEDTVYMPSLERFPIAEDYYACLFHELAHSTGHERRLNRPIANTFGTSAYAREELVAELTAAYLCGDCQIIDRTIEQTAAYLAAWRRKIAEDPRLFVVSAGYAEKAARLIRGDQEAKPENSHQEVGVTEEVESA